MMSPTSIGFVFLLGILHVCPGKLPIIPSNLLKLGFYWFKGKGPRGAIELKF